MMDLIEKFAGGLFIIIPLIWLTSYLYSKQSKRFKGGKGEHMKVINQMSLGPKKQISVVNVGGQYLVLGISSEQITFLTSIEDESVIDTLKSGGAGKQFGKSFGLKRFFGNGNKGSGGSENKLMQMLSGNIFKPGGVRKN